MSPEEVLLHERVAEYEGRELTVNSEAPYSNNRERVVAVIESMVIHEKVVWARIIGKELEIHNENNIVYVFSSCHLVVLKPKSDKDRQMGCRGEI